MIILRSAILWIAIIAAWAPKNAFAADCARWDGTSQANRSYLKKLGDRLMWDSTAEFAGYWTYAPSQLQIPLLGPRFVGGNSTDVIAVSADGCLRYCRLDSERRVVHLLGGEIRNSHLFTEGDEEVGQISLSGDKLLFPGSALTPSLALSRSKTWPKECETEYERAISVLVNASSPSAPICPGLAISLRRIEGSRGRVRVELFVDDNPISTKPLPHRRVETVSFKDSAIVETANARVTLRLTRASHGGPDLEPFVGVRAEIVRTKR